jgi:hypothetical protein
MQNTNTYQLAELILEEHFSKEVKDTATDLLNNGASSILEISKRTNYDFQSVRNSLIILLQNKLTTFEEVKKKDFIEFQYSINLEHVLNFIRFPKILYFINSKFGENAVLICEEIMQFGILSANQCIEQVQFKLKQAEKSSVIVLNSVKVTFVQLIESGYLVHAYKTRNDKNVKNSEVFNSPHKKSKKFSSLFIY